jgi:hypothetical protein
MTKRHKGDNKTFQPYFDSETEKSSVGPLSELALIDSDFLSAVWVGENPESERAVDDATEVSDLAVEHDNKPAFLTDYWWWEIRSIHNNAMIFLGLTTTRPSVDSISLTEVLVQHVHKIVGAQGAVENGDTYRDDRCSP